MPTVAVAVQQASKGTSLARLGTDRTDAKYCLTLTSHVISNAAVPSTVINKIATYMKQALQTALVHMSPTISADKYRHKLICFTNQLSPRFSVRNVQRVHGTS